MATALALAGPAVVALSWTIIRKGGVSVWSGMAASMAILGALSLLTGAVRLAEAIPASVAVLLGVGAGIALYLATAAFLSLARHWDVLARHTAGLYARRGGLSLAAALALAAGVSALGEEIFWRGVVQSEAVRSMGEVPGAAASWGAYVGANAFSGSVPIVLGAAVGGVVWTALASWTGGIAASLGCHAAWTALMVAFPPLPGEERA